MFSELLRILSNYDYSFTDSPFSSLSLSIITCDFCSIVKYVSVVYTVSSLVYKPFYKPLSCSGLEKLEPENTAAISSRGIQCLDHHDDQTLRHGSGTPANSVSWFLLSPIIFTRSSRPRPVHAIRINLTNTKYYTSRLLAHP